MSPVLCGVLCLPGDDLTSAHRSSFLHPFHLPLPPCPPCLVPFPPSPLLILSCDSFPFPTLYLTYRPHSTDTIMGQGFLQAIRGSLVFLA